MMKEGGSEGKGRGEIEVLICGLPPKIDQCKRICSIRATTHLDDVDEPDERADARQAANTKDCRDT